MGEFTFTKGKITNKHVIVKTEEELTKRILAWVKEATEDESITIRCIVPIKPE